MVLLTATQRPMQVQLVGEQAAVAHFQLKNLFHVDVTNCNVCTIYGGGAPESLAQLLPRVRQVTLTSNTLKSWRDALLLCEYLPALSQLDLSNNPLDVADDELRVLAQTARYPKMRSVAVNYCQLEWRHACALLRIFTGLEELHMCNNSVSVIECACEPRQACLAHASTLRVLNLDCNAFSAWEQAWRLAAAPHLQSLMLTGNNLHQVLWLPAPEFTELQELSLTGNTFSTWESIADLDRFPALARLRLRPEFTQGAGGRQARAVVIALIGRLAVLNGSPISPQERQSAESLSVTLLLKQQQQGTKQTRIHRLAEEQQRQQQQQQQSGAAAKVQSLSGSAGLVHVTLQCNAPSATAPGVQLRALPCAATVQSVKAMARRLFGVPAGQRLQVYLKEGGSRGAVIGGQPQLLDDDACELWRCGVATSDVLLVEEAS
eukprot:TRINITY_DN8652_c0_g1_i1.p1 TRINITY_DN8652_c0_g1~~TRINITY_DN8652_c0_g1_i1.p1  ORF type:complete len:467 (+),score=115.97 TRINITY_DN8652_c0_g1_i1:100-1401(+)